MRVYLRRALISQRASLDNTCTASRVAYVSVCKCGYTLPPGCRAVASSRNNDASLDSRGCPRCLRNLAYPSSHTATAKGRIKRLILVKAQGALQRPPEGDSFFRAPVGGYFVRAGKINLVNSRFTDVKFWLRRRRSQE